MTSSVPVSTSSDRYAVAVAELPLRTHRSDAPSGAIVVVDGGPGWCDAVQRASADGAAVIVVARPTGVPAGEIRELIDEVGACPVVVERPLLRSDAAEDVRRGRLGAGSSDLPRLIVADCAAPVQEAAAAMRDALGWLRLLAGGDLAFRSGDGGGLGLFERSDGSGMPAAVTAVEVAGVSRLHIHALGEVLTEVEATAARTTVATSTGAGRTSAPMRYESSERLSLRRALDVIHSGGPLADLADLAKDAALAERLRSSFAHKHQ